MRRPLAAVFLLSFSLLVLGTIAFLRSQAAADLVCAELEARGSELLDASLLVGRCELDPIGIELTFYDVSVKRAGSGLQFDAERIRLKLRELQAPSKRLLVDRLEITHPVLQLQVPSIHSLLDGGASKDSQCEAVAASLRSIPLRVLELGVSDGVVLLNEGKTSRLKLEGLSLHTQGWQDSVTAQLEVPSAELNVGRPLSLQALKLRGEWLGGAALAMELKSFSTKLGGLTLGGKGAVSDLCAGAASFELETQGKVAAWSQLLGASKATQAQARGELRVSLSGERELGFPTLTGRWSFRDAALDGRRIGDATVTASFHAKEREIEISELTTNAMGGALSVAGTIKAKPPWESKLTVMSRGGSLEGLVEALGLPGAWVDATLNGGGSVHGSLWPLELEGKANIAVADFLVENRPVRDGPALPESTILALGPSTVRADVVIRAEAIEVRHGVVSSGDSTVRLKGSFPLTGNAPVDVQGSLGVLELGRDLPEIAQMAYAGTVRGPFTLQGTYNALHIQGQVAGRGVAIDGLEAGVISTHLDFQGLTLKIDRASGQRGRTQYEMPTGSISMGEDPKNFEFQVEVEKGRASDLVSALLHWHPLAKRFVGLEGEVHGSIHVKGPLERSSFQADATLREGTFRGTPFERAELRADMVDRERLEIAGISVRQADGGRADLRGVAAFEGPLALSLSVRDFSLQQLELGSGSGSLARLEGKASGDVVVGGEWSTPEVTGALGLQALALGGRPLGAGHLGIRLLGRALELRAQLRDGTLKALLKQDLGKQSGSLGLWWDDPSLDRWAVLLGKQEALAGWSISSRGEASLSGSLDQTRSWQGKIQLESLTASQTGGTLSLARPTKLLLQQGVLSTASAGFVGAKSSLELSGSLSPDQELDLSVEAEIELAGVAGLFPAALGGSTGKLSVKANLGGTLRSPVLLGSGHVHDAKIHPPGLPLTLSQFGGDLSFSKHAIVFESFTGVVGRGKVDLSGELRLRGLELSRIHLVGRLDDVRIKPSENVDLILAGGLFLDGTPRDLFLSGDLQLVQGRYHASLGVDQLLPWARERGASASNKGGALDLPLRLDVAVAVPGSLRIVTPELGATLQGNLRVVGTLAEPALRGTLDANEAEATFRGNRFRVSHAVLDFAGPAALAPSFDVNAETEVQEYRVYVHAFGTPQEPRVALNSDPQLAEADLLTLLTLGMTARDAEGLQSGEAAFAVMDALFAAAGLDRQVQRFLPDNAILRAPRLRLTSGFSRGNGQVEARVAFESGLFTDKLRLRYSAPIGSPGQRATAEYRITDRMSAQAEWDTESRESQLGNLGIDLKLRWEME